MKDEQKFLEDEETSSETYHEVDFRPSKEEKSQERLERLMSDVERGWKITIMREQPTWCRGHLETWEVYSPDETIDINYLIHTWGGHRLHIKILNEQARYVGGGSISLFSYPPLVRGQQILEHPPIPPSQTSQPIHHYHNNHQGTPDWTKIFELLSKHKNTDISTIMKMMEMSQVRSGAATTQNPWEQMMGMLALFKEMRSVFGGFSGDQSSDDQISPVIAEVLRGLISHRTGTDKSTARALVAPKSQSELPLSEENLVNKLLTMDPNAASKAIRNALLKMPEHQRESAIQSFFEDEYEENGEDDLDELSETDDNYVDDESSVSANIHPAPNQGPRRS